MAFPQKNVQNGFEPQKKALNLITGGEKKIHLIFPKMAFETIKI